MTNNITIFKPTKPCPICQKNSLQKYHPFCSNHCANIDLNRWLSGAYVIKASDDEDKNNEQEQL